MSIFIFVGFLLFFTVFMCNYFFAHIILCLKLSSMVSSGKTFLIEWPDLAIAKFRKRHIRELANHQVGLL